MINFARKLLEEGKMFSTRLIQEFWKIDDENLCT